MKRKFIHRIHAILRQGVTPEKLALTFTIGLVLGTFPAIGLTTLLCTLAALFLRLNMPAMQLINYLVYPLQLILMIPFAELGASFLDLPIATIPEIDLFSAEGINMMWDNLSNIFGSAVLAWAVIMTPLSIIFYFSTLRFFKNLKFIKNITKPSEGIVN